jgi:hypothetical protein
MMTTAVMMKERGADFDRCRTCGLFLRALYPFAKVRTHSKAARLS